MRKVLVIAYYFPPQGGAGVQRTLKFVKYLPENNWQPVALTVREGSAHLSDPTLAYEIPPIVEVHRTAALLLPTWLPWLVRNIISRWLLIVDEQIGWYPFAVQRGLEIIRQEKIAAIYTTSTPYTAHLIGAALQRQSGLPWVADFRDPWVDNFSTKFATPLHENLARRLEASVIRRANRITVVSEPMRQAFLSRYPAINHEHIILLPNGFDPHDFENLEPASPMPRKMVIVYTGSFYNQQRTPLPFLKGLKSAMQDGSIPPNEIQVRFVGNIGAAAQHSIDELGMTSLVETTGYIHHRESIAHLLAADLLLLVVGSGPGSAAVLTGKIFEYLAAAKPILALASTGAAADLMNDARAGVIVDPEDITAIREQLIILHHQWQRSELKITPNREVIARYDRRLQATRLAKILVEICP